jgi:hypothetical protein
MDFLTKIIFVEVSEKLGVFIDDKNILWKWGECGWISEK